MMSAELLLGSHEAAAELGQTLDEILSVTAIARQQVLTGEGLLPLHKVVNFLNLAAERFACDYFGLLVATHQPPARFALVGQLIRFAPTLADAIEDAIRFSLLNSEYSSWELIRQQDRVALIRHARVTFDAPMLQMKTMALALVYKAMNAISGRRIRLHQVHLSVDAPSQPARLEQFFSAPLLFNQPITGIVFSPAELVAPIPAADERIHRLIRSHLETVLHGYPGNADIVEKVCHYIRQTVGSRHCCVEGLCADWGIHPRSLQRQLKSVNTSFRTILLEVRQALAEDYLRDSAISVAELADILGYSNASGFSRSFKQQVGVSPEHWRRLHR